MHLQIAVKHVAGDDLSFIHLCLLWTIAAVLPVLCNALHHCSPTYIKQQAHG